MEKIKEEKSLKTNNSKAKNGKKKAGKDNVKENNVKGKKGKVSTAKEKSDKKAGNKDDVTISVKNLDLFYGNFQALHSIDMKILRNEVTALIGPSGCGKSTFLRSLNRMNDLVESARITGEVRYEERNVYGEWDVIELRKKVGMVFQKPNPFPMSVFDNVAYGPRTHGIRSMSRLEGIVEESLKAASLWDEVADRLHKPAMGLSGGQQQRLCIARVLAVEPDVVLMDEPTSALDPISTSRVEDLVSELKKNYTIVIVTHNMQQAGRVSDKTAFFLHGRVEEFGETDKIFFNPESPKTEAYISGKFG